MQYTEDTLGKNIRFIHDDRTEGLIAYRDIGSFTPASNSQALGQIVATMLFRCIEIGDLERIKTLLNISEFNINEVYYVKTNHEGKSKLKRTALMHAIENIQFDVVKLLIEKKANVNVNHLGLTALRLASVSYNNNPMSKDIYEYLKCIVDNREKKEDKSDEKPIERRVEVKKKPKHIPFIDRYGIRFVINLCIVLFVWWLIVAVNRFN